MRRAGLWVVCALLLAACGRSTVVRREHPGHGAYAPARSAHAVDSGTLPVQRGDTLYGIAFRAGVDYRDLARWNGIAPPYTIYPGQRLRWRADARGAVGGRPAPPPVASSSRAPASRPPNPASAPPRNPPALAPAAAPAPASTPVSWRWPTQGSLLSAFVAGDNTRQGIDIAGQAGQAVAAAGDGTVVYSGSGLVGYGELVIVKHSDEWLSAYGHNRRRLVTEGERVSAGQTIAEMGRTGASRDMLHFEIRRNGKPVDPLPLLPKP